MPDKSLVLRTTVAVVAIVLLFLACSNIQYVSKHSHKRSYPAWQQSSKLASTVKSEATSMSFKPVMAHATHPTSRKVLMHNATTPAVQFSTQQSFFDAQATDLNAKDLDQLSSLSHLTLKTLRKTLVRPSHRITHLNTTREQRMAFNAAIEWQDTSVEVPDVTDRETLRTLAMMASNAYTTPNSTDWWGLDDYNSTTPFGWEKDADGLRGHVFASDDNSTVIISIKGTSAGLLGGGGNTAKNDKFNDNLLFSCCCARVDFTWSTVCDCYCGGWKCGATCLENATIGESVYTTVGTNLYNNVSLLYPDANIWLVGHSLGGGLASLIGLSFGAPVVAFESPGDMMAAKRLHLPLPPGMPAEKMGITHVYNNADPIAIGECVGPYSGCYAAGFAIETRCHVGQSIVYDTVGKKSWSVDLRAHRIGELINRVLDQDWDVPPSDQPVDPPEPPDQDMTTLSRILALATDLSWARQFYWEWPGWKRKLPGAEPAPSPDKGEDDEKKKQKKKNPNAVPKAKSERKCKDCSHW